MNIYMNVVKNKKLKIPLYHGTSSIFLNSIEKYGLGGKNVVESLNAISFFKELYEIANKIFKNDDKWPLTKIHLKSMADQETTKGGFNFKHGNVYLTPSEISGVRYAGNSFGSELLSEAIKLYKKIKDKSPGYHFSAEITKSPILKIIKMRCFPILLKINHIEIENLKTEQNENIDKTLRRLDDSRGTKLFDILSQQLNFVLLKPIKPDKLKIFKVTILRGEELPEYRLKLIRR